MSKARSWPYRAGRTLGDVEAAEKGPEAYAKRRARRSIHGRTNGTTRRLLRIFGL